MKDIKSCLTSNSDEWSTPSNIYNRFLDQGYYDPYPRNHINDGLCVTWKKKTFVNPPYSKIEKWVDKAIFEFQFSNIYELILLVPSRTDTQWFKKLVDNEFTQIQFIEGRLKFNDSKSAPFPSCFVIFNRFMPKRKFIYLDKKGLKEFYE